MLNPLVDFVGTKARVKYNGDCLKQVKIEIEISVNITSYPTLENCLFCLVKLTKNVDVDLYKYSGYGIGFDRKGSYSIVNDVGRM